MQRLKPAQKDIINRLKSQLKDTHSLEEVLRKFSRDNKDQISEDELLIGISKLNSNVYLGDIKELTNILKDGKEGAKISIAETV